MAGFAGKWQKQQDRSRSLRDLPDKIYPNDEKLQSIKNQRTENSIS
jgi:hypothetical protein